MNGNGYRLLGYVVWQGGKWYVRRRLPSARRVVVTVVVGTVALAAAGVLVRRASA